jgi:gliding motility-associated-like protein
MTTYGCRDTAFQHIHITGPTGSFSIRPDSRKACRGDEITLQIGETQNVFDFEWDLGDGRFLKGDTVSFRYARMGTLFPKLLLYGDSGICKPPPVVDSVLIYEVMAGIMMQDTGFCDQRLIHFADTSVGNTQRTWTFSHGVTGTEQEMVLRFSPGSYTVEMLVMNDIGCSDTATADFVVHALPDLVLSGDTLICEGDTAMIFATGGDVIRWTPPEGLNDAASFNPLAYPAFTTVYTAESQSLSTGCRNTALVTIMVQPEPEITLQPEYDTVIIGETISVHADSLYDVTYSWSPADGLSCITCASPVAQPMQSTVYTLTVEDTSGCFSKTYNLYIEVVEAYSLEVPTAFTPNGDTENDVVYVKGWGIRKLVEFRIYNRWGNEVFFSDDLNRGWDGMYKGKIQNIDTYMYTVTVELYNGSMRSKKGTINLLR